MQDLSKELPNFTPFSTQKKKGRKMPIHRWWIWQHRLIWEEIPFFMCWMACIAAANGAVTHFIFQILHSITKWFLTKIRNGRLVFWHRSIALLYSLLGWILCMPKVRITKNRP